MPTPESRLSDDDRSNRDHRRKLVGNRIRELRMLREMSQEQLGHAAGLDRTSIIHLEAGRRSLLLDRLWGLAHALGVTVAALVDPIEKQL